MNRQKLEGSEICFCGTKTSLGGLRHPLKTSLQEAPIARPKTPDPLKKTEALRVRLTVEERALLMENAAKAGLSSSEFLRRAAFNQKITLPPPSGVDFATRQELSRIGINLNQIAKVMNSGGTMNSAHVDAVAEKLDVLFDHIFTELGYM